MHTVRDPGSEHAQGKRCGQRLRQEKDGLVGALCRRKAAWWVPFAGARQRGQCLLQEEGGLGATSAWEAAWLVPSGGGRRPWGNFSRGGGVVGSFWRRKAALGQLEQGRRRGWHHQQGEAEWVACRLRWSPVVEAKWREPFGCQMEG